MDRAPQLDHVLAVLRTHADEFRRRGIRRAAVFGSVAHGEAGPDNDVDVDLDKTNVPDLFAYVGLETDLVQWIGWDVHLAVREGLRPYIRPEVARDAVYAF